MTKSRTVDPKVHDLAEFWLSDDDQTSPADHDARVQGLAGEIQRTIEDWLQDETDYLLALEAHDADRRLVRHLTDTERAKI